MLSAVTIALFASVLALSRPAAAADAERSTKNDTIIYQKHTYTRIDKASFASGEKPKACQSLATTATNTKTTKVSTSS